MCYSMGVQETDMCRLVKLAAAFLKLLWIKELLKDFNELQTETITVYEDNQNSIKMEINYNFREKTTHSNTKYYFLTDSLKTMRVIIKSH